jgi:hypothetical protein
LPVAVDAGAGAGVAAVAFGGVALDAGGGAAEGAVEGVGAAVASAPHCALRKSFHFISPSARFLGGFVLGTALFQRKCVRRIAVNNDGEEKRTDEYVNLTENHWFEFLHLPIILNAPYQNPKPVFGSNVICGCAQAAAIAPPATT